MVLAVVLVGPAVDGVEDDLCPLLGHLERQVRVGPVGVAGRDPEVVADEGAADQPADRVDQWRGPLRELLGVAVSQAVLGVAADLFIAAVQDADFVERLALLLPAGAEQGAQFGLRQSSFTSAKAGASSSCLKPS